MEPITRVLDVSPVESLAAYEAMGGGSGLRVAVDGGGDAVMAVLQASGLRGRGGAGFPTATKWRSVIDYTTDEVPATVVVNAAEGEPGSFKDRAIISANPYRVLEGALIAAVTIGADEVIVATKRRFSDQVARLRSAAAECRRAGWAPGVTIDIVEGPDEYLYGEETALLEVVEGRQPFPRIAPPWRRGVDGSDELGPGLAPVEPDGGGTHTPPVLVNNVETLAHVALIVANGPDWFRQHGTPESPGTLVCTITGHLQRCGVVEVAMGTSLRSVIDDVGGKPLVGEITAAMSGVSNAVLPARLVDTPLTYEDMAAVGSGLGTGGFIVFDASVDPVAVAHGVSRFLAVESCGQCTPCKQDGKAISDAIDHLRGATTHRAEMTIVETRLETIETGARCFLATQHRRVVESLLDLFPDAFIDRATNRTGPTEPYVISELEGFVDGPDGTAPVYDERHRDKQPDWTYDATDSGTSPVERFHQPVDPTEQP
ncbi:MAG: hypothetical protein JWN46_2926 [Acidimicrobiales bacterium]|nr:hypothetical protein [Acidimicrobiales bacterium]